MSDVAVERDDAKTAAKKTKTAVEKKNQRLEKLQITYMPASEISPNPWNPNRQSEHDFELLLRSMGEDGFTQPIVVMRVNEESKQIDDALKDFDVGQVVIVDGEHRWRAGQQLGYSDIPVVEVPMNVAQARIATLRHNRARGSEDIELAAEVLRDLRELDALDWAADSLMIDDDTMTRMLDDIPAPEALAAPEFGEAWAPAKQGEDGDIQLSDRRSSATPAAIEAQRQAEKRMEEARSEEERKAIRRDLDVFRFAAAFSGDESKIVRAVVDVGDGPATNVLRLCREHLEREGQLDVVLAGSGEDEGDLPPESEDAPAE